jgi:ubiquinone/menaquinone biosynthesis C-methylase UbiE
MADAEELPFGDATFDVVYTVGVLHHTPDAPKAVDEIHRVLKPDGRAIIGVYHRYSAFYLFSVLRDVMCLRFLHESYRRTLSRIEYRQNSNACPLVKLYSRRSLRHLLRKFPDVRIECAHLDRSHFGALGRFLSQAFVRQLERSGKLGWFLIAKCTK